MTSSDFKIVADSSGDMFSMKDVPFAYASLKIITNHNEYVDDENLDVLGMATDLLEYEGKSSTSCPSVGDWLTAFGDNKYVFCITITSNLSGSYEAACMAKKEYETAHPDRKVFVIDSLSTGPEMRLIAEKLKEYIIAGNPFEDIKNKIAEYQKSTGLYFMLESMKNLANNGRVSPLVAKMAGVLGIRAVGKASDVGTLEMTDKCRGEKKAIVAIFQHMKQEGFAGGKVRIGHCFNEPAAQKLKDLVCAEFASANVEINPSKGLCSFYAEKGGMLVGFEKANA